MEDVIRTNNTYWKTYVTSENTKYIETLKELSPIISVPQNEDDYDRLVSLLDELIDLKLLILCRFSHSMVWR